MSQASLFGNGPSILSALVEEGARRRGSQSRRGVRVVAIVIDSGGVGALPDAANYGDSPGVDTIGNVSRMVGTLRMPNFERYGLGTLTTIRGLAPAAQPRARVARLRERSAGKDTVTGHWEMTGILTSQAFPTYPAGFPAEVLDGFAAIVGRQPLGNKAASGTEIIEELGQEHLSTGRPILYTSADSVFQVAAHEEVVPLSTLYDWCERVRGMLVAPHNVNRVIARPFVGRPGAFHRTPNRRDYALEPPPCVLDQLAAGGIEVHAVGKICDIYCGHGIASSLRAVDNRDAMEKTLDLLRTVNEGFIFTNLNDFDSKFGHRRDARGYAAALEELDATAPQLESLMRPGDHVVFTADHGCDPTAPGTDHTREYVPFVHLSAMAGAALGDIQGLDFVGATVKAAFEAR